MSKVNEIKEEWEDYYKFLEALRRTGVCNMWGASIYLVEAFSITTKEADEILANWMANYEALTKKYQWDKEVLTNEKD